jgi:hypothetical protein
MQFMLRMYLPASASDRHPFLPAPFLSFQLPANTPPLSSITPLLLIRSDPVHDNAPMYRRRPVFIALVAHPSPIPILHHLFITPVRVCTSGVRKVLRLDEPHHRRRSEIVGLVAHPQVLIFSLADRLELVQPWGGIVRSSSHGGRVCVELGIAPGRIVPILSAHASPTYCGQSRNKKAHHPRRACASLISGLRIIVALLNMLKLRPPKSPTLTPLKAITGASSWLKVSACLPHRVRRTAWPDWSTSWISRLAY